MPAGTCTPPAPTGRKPSNHNRRVYAGAVSTLTVLLAIALTIRVTRILVADQISYNARAWVVVKLGPDHQLSYFVTCPWCVSVWVGAAVGALAYYYGDTAAFLIAGLAAAGSMLAGYSATHLEPGD